MEKIIYTDIAVIGAGPTGIVAAYNLARLGYKVSLFEKEESLGGNILKTYKLFPNFQSSNELLQLFGEMIVVNNLSLQTGVTVTNIRKDNNHWISTTNKGETIVSKAVLMATGFKPFDAHYKEEYGYGIYNGVITSLEFEKMLKCGEIYGSNGITPEKIAILNCVGSRDAKVGNNYCSRVCCINAVKFGIEIKEILPKAEVYCFYMDLRMTGQFYEELYRKSQQEYGVNYIRGKISEASQTADNRIQLKAEDTLLRLPIKMTVDLLILMIGIEASESTKELSAQTGIMGEYGFAKSHSLLKADNHTIHPGLFIAGTCKRPFTYPETVADARAAVVEIQHYLENKT